MKDNPLKIFQPNRDNFNIEWLEEWEQEGFPLKSFRITTNVIADKPVRTYGIIGFPKEQGVLPAILHVHGGGQTASPENVIYNLKRGYICMSFDWTGPTEGRDDDKVSHSPKEFHKADYEIYDDLDSENIKIACAVKAARCCLTFLASFDNVDSDNIGFYGISWGGFATWLINGTDTIAKCSVAIYGTGGLHHPRHLFNQFWVKASDQQKKNWMTVIEPRNYINCQNAPILHINGANDFFGGFDTAAEMLPMISNDWRCDFTPNCNHHFDGGSDELIDYWFDHYLKGGNDVPASPEITAELKDSSTLIVRMSENPQNCVLHYSCGTSWHLARSWKSETDWHKDENGYFVELKVVGETWLFARKTFDNNMTMSSTPLCFEIPVGSVEKTKVLFEPGEQVGGWGRQMGTEIFHGRLSVYDMTDDGVEIISEDGSFDGLMCYAASDPVCKATDDDKYLNIQVAGLESLTITAQNADVNRRTENYVNSQDIAADGEVKISKDDFKHDDAGTLKSFANIAAFNFGGKVRESEKAVIKKIYWS